MPRLVLLKKQVHFSNSKFLRGEKVMIALGLARRLKSLGGVIKVNRHWKDFLSQLLRNYFTSSDPHHVWWGLSGEGCYSTFWCFLSFLIYFLFLDQLLVTWWFWFPLDPRKWKGLGFDSGYHGCRNPRHLGPKPPINQLVDWKSRWPNKNVATYCWWLKSCTTWDVWNPKNNGKNYLSTVAGFQPSTVSLRFANSLWRLDRLLDAQYKTLTLCFLMEKQSLEFCGLDLPPPGPRMRSSHFPLSSLMQLVH